MSFSSLPDSLKRGVGRRIFGFFLLAGILPVLVTAGLAYHEVSRGLEQDLNRQLRQNAKNYGINALGRLQQSSRAVDQLQQIITRDGGGHVESHTYLLESIDSIAVVSATEGMRTVFASGESGFDFAAVNDAVIKVSQPQLLTLIQNGRGYFVFIRPLNDGSAESNAIVFAVKPESIWGSDLEIPFATNFCAFTQAGQIFHCTRPMDDIVHSVLIANTSKGNTGLQEWQGDADRQIATMWQLFLAGQFGAPALDIVASQPVSYALRSRTDFSRVFIPALGLVVVLIGLLSFSMIGQSLVPLQRLTNAARQVAAGNFLSRVRIRSNDEFEWLGDAFNKMASRLGHQISTLEAMSGIDRLILAGATFEEVSESVIKHLMSLTECEAGAVIARDTDSPHWAKMISSSGQEFEHERISLPMELGHQWCQPRQVSLEEVSTSVAPYRVRFQAFGLNYALLIPVILNDELKGLLLLGSSSRRNMDKQEMQRCADLAGRFAVALANTEREEALYRQAHFDELTNLPNRQLLKDRLAQNIVQARRDNFTGALLFLDLDRFKAINDVHGHSVGDIVLVQASERIISELRDSDTVARLGGDEFVVVLPHVSGNGRVRATATRLLDRLAESFSVRGENHFVGASIGVVMFPDDGDSVETLLKNADAAMYRAKEAGRGRFEFFSKELNAESRRKIDLERDLRAAYYNNELEVHYQPQFDITTGVISGAEALLRWEHAEEGYISPAEFVPLAEDSELIVEIGRWVIEQACWDLTRILSKGLHPGPVSVNVSTRQLREGRFVSDVLEPLKRFDIHPGYLQLEVTETTVAQNRDTAIELLTELRNEGVHVAIDDFGTGYSSLSYLQQLPFDVLKIDKSFVDRIGTDTSTDQICRTIIRMAHELGKKSIAEGVESRQQVDFLKKHKCHYVQGFFYSEPLAKDDFIAFIEKQEFHTQRRKALEIIKT